MAGKNHESGWDSPTTAVSELAAPTPGASSPFGDDLTFPLPAEHVGYVHPSPAERPHLAEGR